MTDVLIQIRARHFVAGAVFKHHRCVKAAPIIHYMLGKTSHWVVGYCEKKGWKWVVV